MKQNMEKDDMNAKSLSTILHLKGLTEQAEKEKEARQQEAKSAQQVTLAARLAENAKERVAEEAVKEKKVSMGLLCFGVSAACGMIEILPLFFTIPTTISFWKIEFRNSKRNANV